MMRQRFDAPYFLRLPFIMSQLGVVYVFFRFLYPSMIKVTPMVKKDKNPNKPIAEFETEPAKNAKPIITIPGRT